MFKLLLLCAATSVFCGPIYNTNCLKPIHFELDVQQGLNPDLNTQHPFGYVYNLDDHIKPDMLIQHSDSMEWIPNEAAIVLSHISMNPNLVLKGRTSDTNAERLKKIALNTQFTDIQVDSFAFDRARRKWYSNNNIPDGISGNVLKMDVIHHVDGFHEVLIELASESCQQKVTDNVYSSKKDQFHELIDSAVLL